MIILALGAAAIAFSPDIGWGAGGVVPPGDEGKMAVGVNQLTTQPIRVTEVKWVGYGISDGTTNYETNGHPPEMGGSDRIFIGRNNPPGRSNSNAHWRILVEATLSAAPAEGTTLTVYFKVFDPDHYSTEADFDPNGVSEPKDNVEAGGQVLSDTGAHLELVDESGYWGPQADSVTITGDGTTSTVKIGMRFDSWQPCNNFKVAAHCSKRYIDYVMFADDGVTLKADGPTGPDAPQTDLLTVWRKLHVERDSMGAPVYTQGVAPSRIATGGIHDFSGPYFVTDSTVTIHGVGCNDQFHNGRVQLLKQDGSDLGQPMTVAGNGSGTIVTITLTQDVPTGAERFKNLDDDDLRTTDGVTADDMKIDMSLWAEAYKPACVKVITDKSDLSPHNGSDVNSTNVTFETNIGTDTQNGQESQQSLQTTRTNRQSVSEFSFWCIYQLGAFQGPTWRDNDPSHEVGVTVFGTNWRTLPAEDARSFIYVEACMDEKVEDPQTVKISFANLKRTVSLHESAHQFGLADNPQDGNIMSAAEILAADTDAKVSALTFSPAGLRKIMIKGEPGRN